MPVEIQVAKKLRRVRFLEDLNVVYPYFKCNIDFYGFYPETIPYVPGHFIHSSSTVITYVIRNFKYL